MSTTSSITGSTSALFQTSGLSSGIDTTSIVDALVQLASQPITDLQNQQAAAKAQISIYGQIAAALTDLQTAADGLATGGALGMQVTSQNSAFTATAGSGAASGSYTVQVTTLAAAAKALSAGFGASDTVTGGTLTINTASGSTDVNVADGASLADVASAIQASGAPVYATVLNDGTNSYLSITAQDTGYPVNGGLGVPGDALSFSFQTTGTAGKALGMAVTQPAANAVFQVDGLTFTRTSNLVTDAVPGVTLNLGAQGGPAETLTVALDSSATQANLQKFVDAYNGAMGLIQQQLNVDSTTDRTQTLAGSSTLRYLEGQLQSIFSQTVPGLTDVRGLADLGLKTDQNGKLTIDQTTLDDALARDPSAVNTIFSQPSTGMSAVVSQLVDLYTLPASGLLSQAQSALNDSISQMSDQEATLQSGVDSYKAALESQFAAMEQLVSQMKNLGSYLTAQWTAQSKSG